MLLSLAMTTSMLASLMYVRDKNYWLSIHVGVATYISLVPRPLKNWEWPGDKAIYIYIMTG